MAHSIILILRIRRMGCQAVSMEESERLGGRPLPKRGETNYRRPNKQGSRVFRPECVYWSRIAAQISGIAVLTSCGIPSWVQLSFIVCFNWLIHNLFSLFICTSVCAWLALNSIDKSLWVRKGLSVFGFGFGFDFSWAISHLHFMHILIALRYRNQKDVAPWKRPRKPPRRKPTMNNEQVLGPGIQLWSLHLAQFLFSLSVFF